MKRIAPLIILLAACSDDGGKQDSETTEPTTATSETDATAAPDGTGVEPDATVDETAVEDDVETEDGETHVCAADAEGCPCELEEGCLNDLVCDLDPEDEGQESFVCRPELLCADALCGLNQLCDDGFAGEDAVCLPACAPGWSWNGATCDANATATCGTDPTDPDDVGDDCADAHKECVDATGVTPAQCGACVDGYVMDGATCREPIDCATLDVTCAAEHRFCTESTSSADAFCDLCKSGYTDTGADACEPDTGGNCIPGDPRSLYEECLADERECVTTASGAPSCGDCIAPLFEDPDTGDCALPATCAELGCEALGRACTDDGFAACEACKDGLSATDPSDNNSACIDVLTCNDLECGTSFCVESDVGGDASCVASTCGANQALVESTGQCKTCSGSCNKTGHTGRFWLYTNTSGSCLCETEQGYYLETTLSNLPQPCDADGDGWVRTAAQSYVDFDAEPQIQANARCDVKYIDRVTLQNEWDQRYEVRFCAATSLPVTESNSCTTLESVPLYEETTLDDIDAAVDTVTFPTYSKDGVGRQLRTAELNPLTKACVSTKGDFNSNGIADIEEAAEMTTPSGVTLSAIEKWMLHFSYFIELHRSYYEDRPGEDAGTLVIAERSRCDGDSASVPFPLLYDELSGSDYWRECTRNRAVAYNRGAPEPGFDFARWTCDASSGGCDMPEPPTTEAVVTEAPEHGLCEVLHPPADGAWRGMSHHSQFKCVEVVASEADADEPYELALDEFYDKSLATSGSYQFDDCGVKCPSGDESCAIDCIDGSCAASTEIVKPGDQPHAPLISCEATLPSSGSVGFAAVRYQDGKDADGYEHGCIDEWKIWPQLCPGWITDIDEDAVQTTTGDGVSNDFGALVCGCGENYGGISCDVGCADPLIDSAYSLSPRSGWWMCGGLESTIMDTSDEVWGAAFVFPGDDGDYVIEGGVDVQPRVRTPLCENDDCNTGWSVR